MSTPPHPAVPQPALLVDDVTLTAAPTGPAPRAPPPFLDEAALRVEDVTLPYKPDTPISAPAPLNAPRADPNGEPLPLPPPIAM